MTWRFIVAMTFIVGAASPAAADEKPIWLVVTTPHLSASLRPLVERRTAEGFRAVVETGDVPTAIAHVGRPAYLLLVGDVPAPEEAADAKWHVPTRRFPLYRWRKEQGDEFASDSMWGEFDGDQLPDVPVGRIPARTPAEVATVVKKIIAYEDRPWSLDDLRMPFWTGDPCYGGMVDRMATTGNVMAINSYLPRWMEGSLMCADESSAFCGSPDDQAKVFNHLLRRGGVVAGVGAHGNHDSFFSMEYQGRWCGYQLADVERDLAQGPPTCPLLVFTCMSGNFAGPQRCLTESLLMAPGGPVVAAGATTESHPVTNCLTGLCLMQELASPHDRIGDAWLAGFRSGYTCRNLLVETLLRDSEGKLEPEIDDAQLRRDQLRMYALLGDPATRLRLPRPLVASLEKSGEGWHWRAERPSGSTELRVGFRGPQTAPLNRPAEIGSEQAEALRVKTNAAMFDYEPRSTLAADVPWEGNVTQAGELRLVAFAPDGWHVAVLKPAEADSN